MSTVVIAITSDQHCGSSVALCPPKIELDDGGQYESSKAQDWLWQNWLAFWTQVKRVRDKEKATLYQVFNGDLVDGDHHGTTQILSGNSAVQAHVVSQCMKIPLALGPDKMWFIRGTETHVGKSASAEEKIADGLRRDKRPVVKDSDTGTSSHWHAKLEIQGVRLDLAHHGRIGQRPWTRINVTANLAAEIFYEHAAREEPYPHVAIRSHFHRYVDTLSAHPVRVIQTPAWQLHTAFTHKVVTESMADIGGVILIIRDGKVTVEPVIYKPKSVPTWRG
jgi:hypothetical protein